MKTLRCVAAQGLRLLADWVDKTPVCKFHITYVHSEQIQPDVRRITYDLHRSTSTS